MTVLTSTGFHPYIDTGHSAHMRPSRYVHAPLQLHRPDGRFKTQSSIAHSASGTDAMLIHPQSTAPFSSPSLRSPHRGASLLQLVKCGFLCLASCVRWLLLL